MFFSRSWEICLEYLQLVLEQAGRQACLCFIHCRCGAAAAPLWGKGKLSLLIQVTQKQPQSVYQDLCHSVQWHKNEQPQAAWEMGLDRAQMLGPSPAPHPPPTLKCFCSLKVCREVNWKWPKTNIHRTTTDYF